MKKLFSLIFIIMITIACTTAFAYNEAGDTGYTEEDGFYTLSLLNKGELPENADFDCDIKSEVIAIRDALFSKEKEIQVTTDLTPKELSKVYELVINSEPELFYLEDFVFIIPAEEENRYTIYPQNEIALMGYDDSYSFDAEVEHILSYVSNDMSDLEKAMAVHDYFARFYEYDMSFEIADINDFFREKKGVCQAYADAYTYILKKKLNIDCYTLGSVDLNHAWNVVKIDGEWYHVDVTWDDPAIHDVISDTILDDYFGAASHKYFMISSDAIRAHGHSTYDWEVYKYNDLILDLEAPDRVIEPESTRFDDAIWTKTHFSPFIYHKPDWFYIDNGALYTYDFKTESSTLIKEFTDFFATSFDTFDIYKNTVIYSPYAESYAYAISLSEDGVRKLTELCDVFSLRITKDGILEYVHLNDEEGGLTFHTYLLADFSFEVETPETEISYSCGDLIVTSDTDREALLIVAGETKNFLKKYHAVNVTLYEGKNVFHPEHLGITDDYDEIKIMLWEDLNSMTPLCNSYIIEEL